VIQAAGSKFQFAIAATFTADPVERAIGFWSKELEWETAVRFAPFNQVPQTLLDGSGLFASNQHGLNVVLLRVEDLGGVGNTLEIARLARDAGSRLAQPILLVLCPASPGQEQATEEAARRCEEILQDAAGVQFLTAGEVATLYPVDEWYDAGGERMGKVPYTEAGYAALGTSIVRRAHAIQVPPVKVIALDCDNTLWRGICGEDGPRGVVLEPGRQDLHRFLLEQREAGILLCIASKNNESDVWETFASHAEFPLARRHFATWRINWHSKAANLIEMAAELNVGVDSFLLLDDNPKECAEVEGGAPGAIAIPVPEDPGELGEFLRHLWILDHPVITEEDRRRATSIAQSLEFNREAKQAESLEQFIDGLSLRVDFQPLAHERLGRVAQLTQRTNQFNNSGLRRTESEIQALLAGGGWACYTAEVSDRFGEYGLVGAMLVEKLPAEFKVDTFLLSCRALGRGVEHRMLASLAEAALDDGVYTVSIPWRLTPRNEPVREFLASLDPIESRSNGDWNEIKLNATDMQALRWHPQSAAQLPVERNAPPPASRRFRGYARIASTLRTAGQIQAAIRRKSAASAAVLDAKILFTETETRLARIWSELLEQPVESAAANFFDLGGHSLLAVMLLMRVREEFSVELSVDDVYAGSLTLGDLARRIEAQQMGLTGAGEYEELLAEIEGLSDEEVRALLEQAEGGTAG
jgi:FkbH-like protein